MKALSVGFPGRLKSIRTPFMPKEVLPAMTQLSSVTGPTMWVAIDIAKVYSQVLVEFPDGRRRHFCMANTLGDFAKFAAFLAGSGHPCRIAFEATGDYHRPLTHFLRAQGFALCLVSSMECRRLSPSRRPELNPPTGQSSIKATANGAPGMGKLSGGSLRHRRCPRQAVKPGSLSEVAFP
jgi:hypothetical protein